MNLFELFDDFKFDKTKPIKLFEAFVGIGTQHMALKRLNVDVDLVGISEIDKFALRSYHAIHGGGGQDIINYGGIGELESLPDGIDICTWSFPCQDISLAGKQKGMVEGSRSNYGYIFLDTVERTKVKPKVLLMENVKALFSKRFHDDWVEIQQRLEKMGYYNYFQVLNAKDYGVAQNRERVFIVSILGHYNYTFPKPFKLKKRLIDYLEEEVDERYYLTEEQIKRITTSSFQQEKNRIQDIFGVSATLLSRDYKDPKCVIDKASYIAVKQATKKGYALAEKGDGIYIDRPHQKRGVVQKGIIQTIKTSANDLGVVVEDLNVRKITPKESWRLMGIDDKDFYKAQKVNSNSQLYKQAGNAIVVDVLYHIFKELIK